MAEVTYLLYLLVVLLLFPLSYCDCGLFFWIVFCIFLLNFKLVV